MKRIIVLESRKPRVPAALLTPLVPMPPKKQQQQGKSSSSKVDKTFGMKNKKGKAGRDIVRSQAGGQVSDAAAFKKQKEAQKRAEMDAVNALLFQEAKKRSEIRREREKKNEVKVVEEEEPKELELAIEFRRKKLTTRTPVTLERLKAWLQNKREAREAAEKGKISKAQEAMSRGKKVAGLTGRELFSADKTLFVDDEDAADDKLEEREGRSASESESEGEEEETRGAVAHNSDLIVGERVKARYLGGKRWYEGKVLGVNADGTAHIEYDDGDEEEAVPRDRIQPLDRVVASTALAAGEQSVAAAKAGSSSCDLVKDVDAIDLSAVDESLFLNEDLPSDSELEGL